MMMLKIFFLGNGITRINEHKKNLLTIVTLIFFIAMATFFVVAPVAAATSEGLGLNESTNPINVSLQNVSYSEPEPELGVIDPSEEPTTTQPPIEELTPSTTEITIISTQSNLNNSPPFEIQLSECIERQAEYPIYQSSENLPTLTTGDAKFITDSSAILTGTLSNADPDKMYQVRFRYQINGNDGKLFSQSTSVKGNNEFSISVTGLRSETKYVFRAIGGISDPYINDAPDPCGSFETIGTEPSGIRSSIKASIDKDLIDYLDELLPDELSDDESCEYYNSSWEITFSQYKIMILAGIWAEGGRCGYSAHSSSPSDTYTHEDVSNFKFSTGIGPIQVDRGTGGVLESGWDSWSTIKKLEWKASLVSSLQVIYHLIDTQHNKGNLHCIEDMRTSLYTTWFGYQTKAEGKGDWVPDLHKTTEENSGMWYAITGTTWDSVKNSKKSTITLLENQDITLKEIKNNIQSEWDDYHNVVRKIGTLHWKVPDPGTNIDGYFDTYQILAQRLYGSNIYYYMNTESCDKGTEIWAYYNPEDPNNNLKCYFYRTYKPADVSPGSESGSTISEGVIVNMPVINVFTSAVSNPKVGEQITFNYQVSATEGVSNIELWRITDADKHDDSNIADDNWELVQSAQTTTESGNIVTIPSETGTYWYGLHVIDSAGAWACEKTPIRVTIFDESHIPMVLFPKMGTNLAGDNVCIMINLKSISIADKYEVIISNGEIEKLKEYSSLPETILDSEIWGCDLPDGQYTLKYRYHFNENEEYGYSEGYSDYSDAVTFTVGTPSEENIILDSSQPDTSVEIKIKTNDDTNGVLSVDGYVDDLEGGDSTGTYIFRGTTPLNISIAVLSSSIPSGIISSETNSEDYVMGDKVEIKFSKFGYKTKEVNITLGLTDNFTVDLTPETPETGLTDLIAKRIFTTKDICLGEEISFYVEVINDGDIAAGPFSVGLWFYNGTLNLLGKKEVTSIPAHDSLVVSGWSTVWPNDNESYPVIAWADCDDLIDETDEINNLFPGVKATEESQTSTSLGASFSTYPTSGTVPLTVEFTDTSTGNPTLWLWDFDDGFSSTDQNPTHTYSAPGIYSASLTVSNSKGTSTTASIIRVLETSGRTYTVGPSGCDFTKIQDAIYAASDWDHIQVGSGTYYENIIMNKTLIIEGQDTGGGIPTIDGQWLDTVVKIIADNVTFSNFEVINSKSSTYYQNYAGIYIQSNHVYITNCVLDDNSYGIYIPENYNDIFISSSTFSYNLGGGINSYSNNLTVKMVSVGYSSSGYGLRLCSDNFMQNIIIHDGRYGIYLNSNNTLIDSEVRDNYYGIEGGSNNNLQNLCVNNNKFSGISLYDRNTLVNINANENGADSDHYNHGTRISVHDNNTLTNITAANLEETYAKVTVGSHNSLSDITGPIVASGQNNKITNIVGSINVPDTSQYNTITNLVGDLTVSAPYNIIQNIQGSVACYGNFNDINSVCGDLSTSGNRNVVSDVSGSTWSSICGNENLVEDLEVSVLSIGGSRNQVKSFDVQRAEVGGSRNTLTNGTILGDGNYQTTGLSVGGERSTVQNVLIERCGRGVDFSTSQYAVVKDVTIDNCSTGILLGKTDYYSSTSSSYETIQDIVLKDSGGVSINEHQSGPAYITNISMLDTSSGLSIWNSRDILISNISMVGSITSMACINMYDSENNTFLDFRCENTRLGYPNDEEWYYTEGVQLYSSPENTFQNGVILNFTNGINLQSSNLNKFTNVSLFENRVGVVISYSNNTVIQKMDNYHNSWAGLEIYNADSTSIWLSNFINTNNTLIRNSNNTRWYSQNPLQYSFNGVTRTGYLGNFWKGYNGTDSNGDGIGDIDQSFTLTTDKYPLINYWQYYTEDTPLLPPAAGFIANVTEGRDELTVQFTDISAGTVTSQKWDFGDGATSIEKNPVHTYNSPGYYNVTLNVENEWGADSLKRERFIHIDTMRPYANFTAVPVSGDAPLTVNFLDTSQYGPKKWYWMFGDGNTSTECNPTYEYVTSGNYTVNLTVSNEYGSTSVSKMDYIRVTEPPLKTTLGFDPAESTIYLGEETGYAIVLDKAHYGFTGFNLTIYLMDNSIGEIVGISYPSWASLPVNSSLPADVVSVKAVDLENVIEINATNVTLCTVFVRGDSAGTTNLTFSSKSIDDEIAGRYTPDIINGKLKVRDILPFPNPAGGFFSMPTDPNSDDIYEDLDGNGWIGFNDMVIYYNHLEEIDAGTYGAVEFFDCDGNDWAGFNDVVLIYGMIA